MPLHLFEIQILVSSDYICVYIQATSCLFYDDHAPVAQVLKEDVVGMGAVADRRDDLAGFQSIVPGTLADRKI